MRRLGLPAAAEAQFAGLAPDGRARRLLDAYADGVNAWIDNMRAADLPIEYRLINARPERWSAVNTLHLFSRMGWTLASNAPERARAAAASVVGREAAEALFPPHTPIVEPIQPSGQAAPRLDFRRIPPPGVPDSGAHAILTAFGGFRPPADPPAIHASNNWAVAPRRTAGGWALLAGDPHLQMTLPSLWYEAHLVVPGTLDVYGVTIPGAPGIIIGFTPEIAWTFTNTGADVIDYYRETVDDAAAPMLYQVDGAWRPIETRTEAYHGPDGALLHVDTLRFTHRGPMSPAADGQWLSMRWTVLDPNLDPSVFLTAASQPTTRAFLDTMARGFGAPAQNMLVADRTGSIAIRSTGFIPIRPAGSDGLDIHDGSGSASDWAGYWPLERYPQAFDPPQGFLASANQEPKDPRVDSGYVSMDGEFEPWRAMQINRLLRADSAVTPDAMRRYQTDPGSVRADLFMPFFLNVGRAAHQRGAGSASIDSAVAILSRWDRRYTRDSDAAALFEVSMRELVAHTWDELAPEGGRRVATPSSATLLGLLHDSASPWWDRRATEGVEQRDDVVARALEVAHDTLTRAYGPRAEGGWRWSRRGATRVNHLLGLPAFSELDVAIQGGPGTLNPSSRGGHGPSWRMVVELGDPVRAWGTYPGGQSGNPFNPRYADRLPLWREGALDTLRAPRDTTALTGDAVWMRLRLQPGNRP
jgi:penicillin amidase